MGDDEDLENPAESPARYTRGVNSVFLAQGAIAKSELAALSQRFGWRGALQLAGHLAMLAASSLLVAATRGSPWLWPAIWKHGVVLVFLFAPLHETILVVSSEHAVTTTLLRGSVATCCSYPRATSGAFTTRITATHKIPCATRSWPCPSRSALRPTSSRLRKNAGLAQKTGRSRGFLSWMSAESTFRAPWLSGSPSFLRSTRTCELCRA